MRRSLRNVALFAAALAAASCVLFLDAGALAQVPDVAGGGGAEEAAPLSARVIQTFIVITVLSLAPGIAMMITCLPFMIVVLGILRQAIGLQQSPPNMMMVSLAMFLTFFVMEPVFKDAWREGVSPYLENAVTESQAIERTLHPFRAFMESRVSDGAVNALADAAGEEDFIAPAGAKVPYKLLIPAFMLSEIQRAFEVGFMIFLPFVLIDLIVASILMAMGMMMVPPAVISLPFKLIFFVLSNGWTVIAAALVRGYAG